MTFGEQTNQEKKMDGESASVGLRTARQLGDYVILSHSDNVFDSHLNRTERGCWIGPNCGS
jgi:hypothetical protein